MKKQLLSLAVIFSAIVGAKAQAPDMGFETWANVPLSLTIQDPIGWASFNALSAGGMPQTVFKETTAPHVYSGSASAKIVTDVIPSTISIPNPLVPGQNMDTAGVLGVGKTQFVAPYVFYGYPYVNRPATLQFACKYTPNTSIAGVPDTAYVIAKLTKLISGSVVIVAQGTFKTYFATTSYAVQSLTMVYDPLYSSVVPDSQQIFISSSILASTGAKKGSTFYVDDFQWLGYVSVNDIAGENVQVSVYPNPASNNINFKSNVDAEKIEIVDITGRTIGTYDVIDNKVSISTENYSSGIYFYNLINSKKEIISRDKFEVVK